MSRGGGFPDEFVWLKGCFIAVDAVDARSLFWGRRFVDDLDNGRASGWIANNISWGVVLDTEPAIGNALCDPIMACLYPMMLS